MIFLNKIKFKKKVYFELNFSDMDSEARISSPDHLVNRKTILDRIGGLQEISGHSRHHNSSRLVLSTSRCILEVKSAPYLTTSFLQKMQRKSLNMS
mgnify:CR=1 FL=1